jgi:type IV secretion system protein VirB3
VAAQIQRTTVFVALTRPQMFAGVTYNFFILNAIVSTELFLVFKSIWVLAVALGVHGAGALLSLHEPRVFELWLTRVSRCPRVRNFALWKCNSYRP